MPYYRNDQFFIQVSVGGVQLDDTSWDEFSGGDTAGNGVTISPGGGPAISLGGVPRRNAIQVQRTLDDVLVPVYRKLDQGTGSAAVTVKITPRDASGRATGTTITYTGTNDGVQWPEASSAGGSDARLQLTVNPNFTIN